MWEKIKVSSTPMLAMGCKCWCRNLNNFELALVLKSTILLSELRQVMFRDFIVFANVQKL